jgi:fimbrial chaperone protein
MMYSLIQTRMRGRQRMRFLHTFLAAALVAASSAANAGQFSVTPVRIYMASKDRATAITLTNEGDTELVMQADVYEWKQKPGGEEDLTLSEDMILAPPIIKLAPKARQVVRLAMLKPVLPGQQLTYRMIVREIPEAKPPEKGMQLQIALAFSLPVFISPPGVKRQLACTLQRTAPSTVNALCNNTGNAYAQPVDFKLLGASGQILAGRDSGNYVLPGIQRSFEIKRTEGPIPGGNVRLQVTQDDASTQSFDVALPD